MILLPQLRVNCKRTYRKSYANCKTVYSSKILGSEQMNCKRVHRAISPAADNNFVEFHDISELQTPFCFELETSTENNIQKIFDPNGPRSTIMLVAISGHGPDHARWVIAQ